MILNLTEISEGGGLSYTLGKEGLNIVEKSEEEIIIISKRKHYEFSFVFFVCRGYKHHKHFATNFVQFLSAVFVGEADYIEKFRRKIGVVQRGESHSRKSLNPFNCSAFTQ